MFNRVLNTPLDLSELSEKGDMANIQGYLKVCKNFMRTQILVLLFKKCTTACFRFNLICMYDKNVPYVKATRDFS